MKRYLLAFDGLSQFAARAAAGLILSLGVSLAMSTLANASVVLSYSGNAFTWGVQGGIPYQVGDHVSGSLTLDAPLGNNLSLYDVRSKVESFSFSDGAQLITSNNGFSYYGPGGLITINNTGCPGSGCPTIFNASFSTDATGNITEWLVSLSQYPNYSFFYISTSNSAGEASDNGYIHSAGGAYNLDNPGVWSIAASVPEPATWAMFLLGFGAIGFTLRQAKRPAMAA